MTDRSRKKYKKADKTGENNIKMYMNIVMNIISLVLSVLAICITAFFSAREYNYKISPEIDGSFRMGIQINENGEEREVVPYVEELNIEIIQKNNLQEAYWISADEQVEKMKIDTIEDKLKSKMKDEITFGKTYFAYDRTFYQYGFLMLKGLDQTWELYLIYSKCNGETYSVLSVSEIEVWSMANTYPGNPEYNGEKEMAKQYMKILKETQDYMF